MAAKFDDASGAGLEMSKRINTYVAATVGAAIASAVAVRILTGPLDKVEVQSALFFGLLILLSELLKYEGSKSGATGSITFLPTLASVMVSTSVATPIVTGLAALIGGVSARRAPIRVIFNVSQYVLATSFAVLVAHGVGVAGTAPIVVQLLGLAIAAVAFHGINTAAVSGAIAIDTRRTIREVWMKGALRTLPYDVMALPVVYLLVWSYREQGVAVVLLFVLPIFGLRQLYKQNYELEQTNEELLQLMVSAIEARDPYTSGHSVRVSAFATKIGRIAKLGTADLEQLRVAAVLHDVGKIHEIYAPILRKAEKLSEEERKLMETHPVRSAELAANVSRMKPIVPALRGHHERWDGHGYPDKLAGDSIPMLARFIAIADTVDAMTSSRPYRAAMTSEEVRRELAKGLGTQFDPRICRLLLAPEAWESFLETVREVSPGVAQSTTEVFGPPPDEAALAT